MTDTPSELATSEVPESEGLSVMADTEVPPEPPSFPPYPPYVVEPAPPSVADAVMAGHGLRLKHKSKPRKSLRPLPKPAKPRSPKATDVKMSLTTLRAHARCLRRHGAVLTDRLERISKPRRRTIIYLWRDNAQTLPPDTISRLRSMLDADEPFKPDQAYEYFVALKKTEKKAAATPAVREIKKDILAMCSEKKFAWARNATVAFARGIQQRLSKGGRYALADGMLRLSDIIMHDMCGYMHMKTPSRRCTNPKAKFMMEMSDKIAVWIDEILTEADDRMLMMDFDEDDGYMRKAFEILTDSMKSKGDEKLLSVGKYDQTYHEAADELKSATDLRATEYSAMEGEHIYNKLNELTENITLPDIANAMTDLLQICTNYLAQLAEYNKEKGSAFLWLIEELKKTPDVIMYEMDKIKRTYTQAAKELENAKGLEADHDEPNLSQRIHSAMQRITNTVTPEKLKKYMEETVDVCARYLSQKAVDDNERGPAFDLLIKILEKQGDKPFCDFPALSTRNSAAFVLKSAPGLGSAEPDPKTAEEFKEALHKVVDAATPKAMKSDMNNVIDLCGNYLSAFIRDRGLAMECLLGMMKRKPKTVFATRNEYTMDYRTGANEVKNAPNLVSYLPIKDIADEGKANLTRDMKDVTPPALKLPVQVLINDVSKYLSQLVALRSGVAGERYNMNFLAAVKRSMGSRPLYKYKSYNKTYGDAADELQTVESTPPPNLSPPAFALSHEIKSEMKRAIPTKLAPTVVADLQSTIDIAAMHLAKIGVEKGDPMDYVLHLMQEKGDEILGKLQGYYQTFSDGARRLKETLTLNTDSVDVPAYSFVKRKLTVMTQEKPDERFAALLPEIIDDSATFLASPIPQTNAEKKQVLADLMARKGDAIIGEKDAYKLTYQEAGEDIKNAPVGVTKAHDKVKNKEILKQIKAVIPNKKMEIILKEPTNEAAAYLTDAIKGRGQALEVLEGDLKKEGHKEFIKVGKFRKDYAQIGKMLHTAPNLKADHLSPVILENVEYDLDALPKETSPDKPSALEYLTNLINMVAQFIAKKVTEDCGLDAQHLAALDAAGFNAESKATAEARRLAAVAAGPGGKVGAGGGTEAASAGPMGVGTDAVGSGGWVSPGSPEGPSGTVGSGGPDGRVSSGGPDGRVSPGGPDGRVSPGGPDGRVGSGGRVTRVSPGGSDGTGSPGGSGSPGGPGGPGRPGGPSGPGGLSDPGGWVSLDGWFSNGGAGGSSSPGGWFGPGGFGGWVSSGRPGGPGGSGGWDSPGGHDGSGGWVSPGGPGDHDSSGYRVSPSNPDESGGRISPGSPGGTGGRVSPGGPSISSSPFGLGSPGRSGGPISRGGPGRYGGRVSSSGPSRSGGRVSPGGPGRSGGPGGSGGWVKYGAPGESGSPDGSGGRVSPGDPGRSGRPGGPGGSGGWDSPGGHIGPGGWVSSATPSDPGGWVSPGGRGGRISPVGPDGRVDAVGPDGRVGAAYRPGDHDGSGGWVSPGGPGDHDSSGYQVSPSNPDESGGWISPGSPGGTGGRVSPGGPSISSSPFGLGSPGRSGGRISRGGPGRYGGRVSSGGPSRSGGRVSPGGPSRSGGRVSPGGPGRSGGPGGCGGWVRRGAPGGSGGPGGSSGRVCPGGRRGSGSPDGSGGRVSPGDPGRSGGQVSPGGPSRSGGPVFPGAFDSLSHALTETEEQRRQSLATAEKHRKHEEEEEKKKLAEQERLKPKKAEKAKVLNILVKAMQDSGDRVLLRHGRLLKSFKDAAKLLNGKTTDQLAAPNPDPIVARKIQIRLTNLMKDETPAQFQALMTEVIEEAAKYLAVRLLEPQVLKECKCHKNVFVQCNLWCDEILQRVAPPCCRCSRHVSVQALQDLSPDDILHVTPKPSRALAPGVEITLKPSPSQVRPPKAEINSLCPAQCHYTTSYCLYETKHKTFGSNSKPSSSPSTSGSVCHSPASSLSSISPLQVMKQCSPLKSLLLEMHVGNTAQSIPKQKEQVQSFETGNLNRVLEEVQPSSCFASSSCYDSGTSTSQTELATCDRCQQFSSPISEISQKSKALKCDKSEYSSRTPITSEKDMVDWDAMMVSLLWNVLSWRDWIQEIFDHILAYQHSPSFAMDRGDTANSWWSYYRRVTTEALQWRQYNKFSRQLTTCLHLRYNYQEIESPIFSTVHSNYIECQEAILGMMDIFSRWTQWLNLVVKETDSLQQMPGSEIPLHQIRWDHLKTKVKKYSKDWANYNKFLKVSWEEKYSSVIADYLPSWNKPGPVWVAGACGAVPSGAVAAGMYDGEVIWVARTMHRCTMLPATLLPSNHYCIVYEQGETHRYSKYQVLCNAEVCWIGWRGGLVPKSAVCVSPGMHVGRVDYYGDHLLGTVQEPHYHCHVVIYGRPYAFDCYELLILAGDDDQ